jgi:hypothetical protein
VLETLNRRGTQQCSACASPDVERVNASLLAGKPYKAITASFGLSGAVLSRHRAHLPDNAPVAGQGKLLANVDGMILELRRILARAKRNKSAIVATELSLKCSRELRSWIGLKIQLQRVELVSTKRERIEPELSPEQLQAAAQAILRKKVP